MNSDFFERLRAVSFSASPLSFLSLLSLLSLISFDVVEVNGPFLFQSIFLLSLD